MQYKKNKKIPKHQSKATEFSVITEQQMGKDSIQYLMNSPKRDKKITCLQVFVSLVV